MSLHWVKKEHKCRAAMKGEIVENLRPDMSQASKAYVYIDFNRWVSATEWEKTIDHWIRQI